MRLIRQHGAFETRIASQHASRCTPMYGIQTPSTP